MKQKRYLSGALVVILLAAMLWYSSIFTLQSRGEVSIQTVSGDASALDGITLEGSLADSTHAYDFILKDGKMNNSFHPTEHLNAIYCDPSEYSYGTVYMMPVIETDSFPIREISESSDRTCWMLTTDRVRMYVEYETDAGSAVFDTGIELQGAPEEFVFSGYPQDDFSSVLWNEYSKKNGYELQENLSYKRTICRTVGKQDYIAVNLPWGGFRLYRITQTEADRKGRVNRYEEKCKAAKPQTKEACLAASLNEEVWGKAVLVAACDADEAGRILELYELGDKLVAITLSNTGCDLAVLDADGRLQKTNGPARSRVEAYVYDADEKLEQVIPIMELPDGTEWNAEVFRCETGADNLLCLDLDVTREYYTRYMQCGAVLKLVDGEVQLLESVSYPYRADPDVCHGSFTKNEMRNILWVQTDDTQSKMAFAWQSELQWNPEKAAHTGGDIFLEVVQDGKTQWLGKFNDDWQQDYLIPEGYASPVMPQPYLRRFHFGPGEWSEEYSTRYRGSLYQYW